MSHVLTLQSGVPVFRSAFGLTSDTYQTLTSDLNAGETYPLPPGQSYGPGQHELLIFIDGVAQIIGRDFTEECEQSVKFLKDLRSGQTIRIRR